MVTPVCLRLTGAVFPPPLVVSAGLACKTVFTRPGLNVGLDKLYQTARIAVYVVTLVHDFEFDRVIGAKPVFEILIFIQYLSTIFFYKYLGFLQLSVILHTHSELGSRF